MKHILRPQMLLGALGLATCMFSQVVRAADAPSPDHPEWAAALRSESAPITVHPAKKMYTMDSGRPEATAIAVLDGKVLSTGTMESMQQATGRRQTPQPQWVG